MKDETLKKDPLEGITYGVTAEDLAKEMGVSVDVITKERIYMATVELGPCSSVSKEICPCPCDDCRFHGRCCECIPHHLRFGKLPNCVPHMRKGSTAKPLLPITEATPENLKKEQERIAALELGPCSNTRKDSCTCNNTECKLHGRCCVCMDHYRRFNMLPDCLRSVIKDT